MNARGASEVDDPKVVEKPMLAPHPSSGNAVHKCTQSRKKAVGMEVCPFSHSPGDDSGGRCSEGQLEDEHSKLFSHYFGIGIQEEGANSAKRVGTRSTTVLETVADSPVGKSPKDEIHGVLHQDVHFILFGHAAGL